MGMTHSFEWPYRRDVPLDLLLELWVVEELGN